MGKKIKSIIFYAATFGIAAFLVWYSFRDFNPIHPVTNEPMSRMDFMILKLKEANLFFIFLSGFLAILSHIIRAERWKILIEPLGQKITLKQGFIAVMIGYFINLVIPRGGEVSRSVTLHKMNRNVKVDSGLGTIVAERVIDLVFLLVCIGVAFLVEFDNLSEFMRAQLNKSESTTSDVSYLKWYVLGALLLFGVFGYYIISKFTLFEGLRKKGVAFLLGLKEGALSVLKLKKSGLFILLSFGIWICYYLMCYTVFLAFPSTAELSPLAALSIFAIGGIAMAIPMPGGTGTYHTFVPAGIIFLYGTGSKYAKELLASGKDLAESGIITDNEATAFAFIFHGWQTLVIIVVGAICMVASNKIIKNSKETEESAKNITP